MHLYWWFVLCHWWTVFRCVYMLQFVHPFTKVKDVWVVSRFWWLWIKPLYIFAYRLLFGQRFLFSLGKSMDHVLGSPQLLWLPDICCLNLGTRAWRVEYSSYFKQRQVDSRVREQFQYVGLQTGWHIHDGERKINNKQRKRWAIDWGRRKEEK